MKEKMNYETIGKIVAKGLEEKDSIMIFRHIPDTSADAIFSECGQFRYMLTVENMASEGNKTVCVIMQNPSVANSEIADKSAQFLEKLVFKKNYTQFEGVKRIIIVNQFAYVQTNDFDGSKKYIGIDNYIYINQAINDSNIILVAWGASNAYSERKQFVNSIINKYPNKILLRTKKHPSRGSYNDFIEPYII